ncbi:hypothetical protein E1293_37020 [Actinomadura darangshiensis]|uniref:Uncharacterized protein n=1 Tax=Actinomadura darangshiensis TaxID=705336 RepID=A0A4R5A9U6_9ACTN|nr:hypothetical protein [Actinomadura darangshiensis]TDD68395.1 hypothetical protein E1293_37020 [Actinomadura darangshiensis]
MEPEPIQREANRPQGRQRHALVPVLVRFLAVAGFAIAGWIALSALSESAYAAEQAPWPAPRQDVQHQDEPGLRGPAALRHLSFDHAWQTGDPADALSRGTRELGDHPVHYLRSRQQDVLDGKDQAVRHVRKLADDAGVPHVRLADVRPNRPLIGGLVHRVTDSHSVLLPDAHERPQAQDEAGTGHARQKAASAAAPGHRTAGAPATAAHGTAGKHADACPGCHGDRRAPAPGPVLPSGQDGPRTSGSGSGHPFTAAADLLSGRYPAAPPAVDRRTILRTALTDVAAPVGPSVVPD